MTETTPPLHEDAALLALVEQYLDDTSLGRREDTTMKTASARAVLAALEPHVERTGRGPLFVTSGPHNFVSTGHMRPARWPTRRYRRGTTYDVGDTWTGKGEPHAGHTITAIDSWPMRSDPHPVIAGKTSLSSGRVRCSCGIEFDTCVPWTELIPDDVDGDEYHLVDGTAETP